MEDVHPIDGSGGLLPHNKTRSGNAANLPPEAQQNADPYPCMLPCARDVANPSAAHEGIWSWYSAEKVFGRVAGIEIVGCAVADTGQNPQAQNGGHATKGSQGVASALEDSGTQ